MNLRVSYGSREVAWHVLRSGGPVPMRQVDPICRRFRLDDRDRALVRILVGTEIRRRGSLRALVLATTRRRPKPEILTHLHLGFVQLLFLDRIPDHAAVSETCDAVARTVGASKVPFVHGVLQRVLRARREGASADVRRNLVGCERHLDFDVFRDPAIHPLLWAEDALSIPAALMKRWVRRYGEEEAHGLAHTFLQPPPLVMRAIGERGALLEELSAEGIEARPVRLASALQASADETGKVTQSAAFREGRLTIQGETAAEAGELMQAQPGERLLDLCAAPGGKSALMAGAGANVLAVDLDPRRLARVSETCDRLGLGMRLASVAGDGVGALREGLQLDGIFLDAPCSNTGVLGARPEARWRFGPKTLGELTTIQERLLREAAPLVRPGGRLIWSTCSLEAEENERRVAAFLDAQPEWRLEEEITRLPNLDEGPWDGGYAARLRRADTAGPAQERS